MDELYEIIISGILWSLLLGFAFRKGLIDVTKINNYVESKTNTALKRKRPKKLSLNITLYFINSIYEVDGKISVLRCLLISYIAVFICYLFSSLDDSYKPFLHKDHKLLGIAVVLGAFCGLLDYAAVWAVRYSIQKHNAIKIKYVIFILVLYLISMDSYQSLLYKVEPSFFILFLSVFLLGSLAALFLVARDGFQFPSSKIRLSFSSSKKPNAIRLWVNIFGGFIFLIFMGLVIVGQPIALMIQSDFLEMVKTWLKGRDILLNYPNWQIAKALSLTTILPLVLFISSSIFVLIYKNTIWAGERAAAYVIEGAKLMGVTYIGGVILILTSSLGALKTIFGFFSWI